MSQNPDTPTQRVIKFRLWNSTNRQFEMPIYVGDELFNIKPTDRLQQFTGLLDRNGVEIYEGDIVKRYDSVGWIEYCLGGFDVDGTSANTPGFGWFRFPENPECMWDSDCLEVIGNIYENPDLLSPTLEPPRG